MMQSRDYYLSRRFFDDKHYPYGFSRSGDFTLSEVQALEKHGVLFQALMEAKVLDTNEEDKLFIKVMKGKKQPQTLAQKAWLKYLKCSKRAPVWLTTRKLGASNDQLYSVDDDFDLEDAI
ncbi:DUF413 domain-containing protein [Pleionea mediterranea]|uniref:Macrodomain Ori protein n=1 Tax=Pleionea mediterranea TaxID=523701 RepID=A0A316FD10_9GAMM|nr:DUF413 domain-containing protein [Pleionea mediterranea]PWK45379.1 hypothetical protein C8D97_11452 [Pleionea mediterranea]